MKNFSFVCVDVVRNIEGEMLAVSVGDWGYLTYHYTKDENRIDEDRECTFIPKRKTDIKKIRSSKMKESIIDKINLDILKNNISSMERALEKASDSIHTYFDKINVPIKCDRTFGASSDPLKLLYDANRQLEKGSDAYSNYLKLSMDHDVGLYVISIERDANKWKGGE